MKKQLIFALLMLVSCSIQVEVNAQSLSFGLRAGSQFTEYTNIADARGAGMLYHAGVYGSLDLSDRFALQAEASFSRQGRNQEGGGYRERAMYINAPLLLKYRISPRFTIMGGGQAGWLMDAKLLGESNEGAPTADTDLKDQYEPVDLAAVIGADLAMTDRLSVGFRTNWGLTSFQKSLEKSRQYVFQVSASYRLFSF